MKVFSKNTTTSVHPNQDTHKIKLSKSNRKAGSYEELFLIQNISLATFTIYLITSKTTNSLYAVKLFNKDDQELHPSFVHQTRFFSLNHPNIIKQIAIHEEENIFFEGKRKNYSYMLMEYAPHGDLFDFMLKHRNKLNEKLIRTMFRNIIEGSMFLHQNGIAHLDLKLDHILICEDYTLKITGFNSAQIIAESNHMKTKGTKYHRAPEVSSGMCEDLYAADIYSLGVILFALKTGGFLPHTESNLLKGVHLYELLYTNQDEFWQKISEFLNHPLSFFDKDFKSLFNALIAIDPTERATMEEIVESKWYNGPIYSDEEFQHEMKKIFIK